MIRPRRHRTTATESLMTEKDRQNELTLPTWLQLFLYVVCFNYFKCTLFLFCFFLFLTARRQSLLCVCVCVWLAECTDAWVYVWVCVCCVHACVVLLRGGVGFVFHYFWHVTDLRVCVGEWEGGGTALSLFLAHYIIIIINIVAVLLLVPQPLSY